jgi:hypothetical protein
MERRVPEAARSHGLFSCTLLTLYVLPALYLKCMPARTKGERNEEVEAGDSGDSSHKLLENVIIWTLTCEPTKHKL